MLKSIDPVPAHQPPARPGPVPVVALILLWAAMLLLGASEADRAILHGAYVGGQDWALLPILVTRLGDWQVLVALSVLGAALFFLRHEYGMGLFLLASTLLGRGLVSLQKLVFGRIRPDEFNHLVEVQSLSFPSGHAANSMIVYPLLALLLAPAESRMRWLAAAIILALLIGSSRVLLSVHWPSDVIGGWAFGLLWVMLCLRMLRR